MHRQAAPYLEPSDESTSTLPLHPPPAEAVEPAAGDEPDPLHFAEAAPQAGSEISVAVGVKETVEAKLSKGESERLG